MPRTSRLWTNGEPISVAGIAAWSAGRKWTASGYSSRSTSAPISTKPRPATYESRNCGLTCNSGNLNHYHSPSSYRQSMKPEPRECLWTPESLWIARELAAGRVQVIVARIPKEHTSVYVSRIQRLARAYPMVYFAPDDQAGYTEGREFWRQGGRLSGCSRSNASSLMLYHNPPSYSMTPWTSTSNTSSRRIWHQRPMVRNSPACGNLQD